MQFGLRHTVALAAFTALIGSTSALPVHAFPAVQADKTVQEPAPVIGELTRVSPEAMTISIKTANGAEMLFRYTDMTTVSGAEKTVAGLATKSGAQLTVTYHKEGTNNVATRIEVREKT